MNAACLRPTWRDDEGNAASEQEQGEGDNQA
jgi:hypothetical protein